MKISSLLSPLFFTLLLTIPLPVLSQDIDGRFKREDGSNCNATTNDNTCRRIDIANGAVTSGEIRDDTITSADIATGAVTSDEIRDDTITSADIADGTISGVDIMVDAIDSSHLGTGSVGSDEVINGSLQTEDFATGSVTTEIIQNGTILLEDLNAEVTSYVDVRDANTLIAANSYTDAAIASVRQEIQSVKEGAYEGIALALAAEVPSLSGGETRAISIAYGNYQGHGALAVGGALRLDSNGIAFGKLGITESGRSGGAIGVQFAW